MKEYTDMFDEDLKEVMGDRYDDGETPTEMPVMECKATPKAVPQKRELVDEQYVPYPKAERSYMDRLRGCATWSCICGAISMLMWWFQVNDLMAMEASYPCILICALLAGFGVGKNIKK